MSDKTDDFMKRLRERVEARERQEQERLAQIMDGKPNRNAGKPARRVTWIEDSPSDEVTQRKNSILDLLRDEVTTKSSSQRGNKEA